MAPRRWVLRVILADAETPLVWGAVFHHLLENLIVGIFEAWLLVRFFGCKPRRTAGLMILANYVSCAGGVGLVWFFEPVMMLSRRGCFSRPHG